MFLATKPKHMEQFVLKFNGWPHFNNPVPGHCGIEIRRDQNPVLVTITEPHGYLGVSVTNNIEAIATQVYFLCLRDVNPKHIRFRHHEIRDIINQESIRDVQMKWSGKHQRYIEPEWMERKVIASYRCWDVKFDERDEFMILGMGEGYPQKEVRVPLSRYPQIKMAKNRHFYPDAGGTVINFYEIPFELYVRDAVLVDEAIKRTPSRVAWLHRHVEYTSPELA